MHLEIQSRKDAVEKQHMPDTQQDRHFTIKPRSAVLSKHHNAQAAHAKAKFLLGEQYTHIQ